MQFRFRIYNEETKSYDLLTYIDIQDYDIMFKTLTYMSEHKCDFSIELNTESIVETLGENYNVIGVSLCISKETGEERLTPHFVVDLEYAY